MTATGRKPYKTATPGLPPPSKASADLRGLGGGGKTLATSAPTNSGSSASGATTIRLDLVRTATPTATPARIAWDRARRGDVVTLARSANANAAVSASACSGSDNSIAAYTPNGDAIVASS